MVGLTLSLLAQVPQQLRWFTEDEVGQKVGLGIVAVLGLIALVIVFHSMRWAAARWKALLGVAVVLAGLYLLGIWIVDLGAIGMIVGIGVVFAMFLGFALYLTHT